MVWAALTGGNSFTEYNLWNTHIRLDAIYQNFHSKNLTTAKTKGAQIKNGDINFMPDHTFAILGCYRVYYNNRDVILIHLFNPWHVDAFVSQNEYNDQSSFWKIEEVKKQNLPFTENAEDGKFFLELYDFFHYFDKMLQMKVYYTMKAITFQIPLLDLADNNVNIELDYGYELYWDIFVGNNFDEQIEPYKATSLVSGNSIIETNIFTIHEKKYRVYQALTIRKNKLISLQVMRYNDDIIDAISFFVYANNQFVLNYKNKSKYLTGCKNNCSSHGTCQGNICNCSHGVNFLSFYQII